MSDDKAARAEPAKREGKLDAAIEETFPASDPPAITPKAGTRKAEQIEQARKAKE